MLVNTIWQIDNYDHTGHQLAPLLLARHDPARALALRAPPPRARLQELAAALAQPAADGHRVRPPAGLLPAVLLLPGQRPLPHERGRRQRGGAQVPADKRWDNCERVVPYIGMPQLIN